MTEFYDREGKRIEDAEDGTSATIVWARMYEDFNYRSVKVTPLSEKREAYVSTIWLGFDMYDSELPLIFETLEFENGRPVDDPVRHHIEQAAIEYHDELVERWRKRHP